MNIKQLINDEGVTDHTAILPTKNKKLVDFDKYTDNEKKILEMIYQNLEEATSKPYTYEKTCVTLSCGGEIFTVNGVRNLELGWKKNRPNETIEKILPNFKKGEKVAIDCIFIDNQQTEPPKQFTDGTLLEAMKEVRKLKVNGNLDCLGIGTPATRAEIIEKLVSGGFVIRDGDKNQCKHFVATEKSKLLYQVLPDSLKSAELTAEWENKLMRIEKGEFESNVFLEEIIELIQNILSNNE